MLAGWHAVNWIEGFTLLHWAAEKGLADFCRQGQLKVLMIWQPLVVLPFTPYWYCLFSLFRFLPCHRYFVALNADPNATDSRGHLACIIAFFVRWDRWGY